MYKRLPFQLGKPTQVTIKRYSKGTYVDGYYEEDSTPTDVIAGLIVTPMIKKSHLTFLSDSVRQKKMLRIFSNTELWMKDEKDNDREADRFTWTNEEYEVVYVAPWLVNGFEAYEAYAVKKDTEVL